jgi:Dyp-type peroxidase family
MTAASFSPEAELKEIQGGLFGFNKDHQLFIYVKFGDTPSAKQVIAELIPEIGNGFEVLAFNAAYGDLLSRQASTSGLRATWVNLWLTRTGLQQLGAPGIDAFPEEFRDGMPSRVLGDVDASASTTWVAPFAGGAEPHAIVVIAADVPDDLAAERQHILDILAQHGATPIGEQPGDARPGDKRGHEHFGFKDGISQPGIEHLSTSSKGGAKIPPGEVLIGYPDADGNVSGQPSQTPAPVPTGYNPTPPPPLPAPLPPWTKNGSFVVFRRLRQDVGAFQQAMQDQAAAAGRDADKLAAKVVGRWPSGAPLESVPGLPHGVDPTAEDPSVEHEAVLENEHINNFDYTDDKDAARVPRAAHIRKMNPRADVLPDGDSSGRHRMVRRGIPYGPEFQPGETPYGQVVPDTQDRGLLFVNYQSSIARTFEFVQTRWANVEEFQQPGDGEDPIISQDKPDGTFAIPPDHAVTFRRWVTTTGGAYLFAPSLSGLGALASTP